MLTQVAGAAAHGATLAELLARGPLDATRASAILRQLCDALEPTHRAGLVHRDLRPANIVVERDGARVSQLRDAGLASVDDAYRAPEQVTGGKLDHRCDQYALGVIAHEMLARVPGVKDALLEAIVRKMRAPRADDRFTNLRAVKQVLELLAGDRNRAAALLGMPVAEHAIPARRRTPGPIPVAAKPGPRWPWLAGVGAIVVAGVIRDRRDQARTRPRAAATRAAGGRSDRAAAGRPLQAGRAAAPAGT